MFREHLPPPPLPPQITRYIIVEDISVSNVALKAAEVSFVATKTAAVSFVALKKKGMSHQSRDGRNICRHEGATESFPGKL